MEIKDQSPAIHVGGCLFLTCLVTIGIIGVQLTFYGVYNAEPKFMIAGAVMISVPVSVLGALLVWGTKKK